LITARHCLSHTTGFPNWRQFNPHDNQKLEIFFTPGEKYAYSGEGLYLLQLVIETITGRQLEDLAQEKIFKPFDMTRTSFLWQSSFENDYAVGNNMSEDRTYKYVDSTFIIFLEPKGKNVVLHAIHTNVPDKDYEGINKGWHQHYWEPWKKYLAGKPVKESIKM